MSEASLQQVVAFNREIAALSATGLPLQIGLPPGESLESGIDSINAALSLRVGRGESLDQAIREASELPARYRAGLLAWLHHSDPTIALDGFAVPAETRRDFGRHVGRTLFYPLLLLCLAFGGLVLLCLFTAPAVEGLYYSMFHSTEQIGWLNEARELLPIWAVLFPLIVILVLIVWRRRFRDARWRWVPGSRRYYEAVEHAYLAKQLANLVQSGRSVDESLALVQSTSQTTGTLTTDQLPSLLKWAVTTPLSGESLSSVLRLVAESYRHSAERRRDFWRLVMPTIAGAVLGGLIVMAYGMGLFLPLIDLLHAIAQPGGA